MVIAECLKEFNNSSCSFKVWERLERVTWCLLEVAVVFVVVDDEEEEEEMDSRLDL